METRGSTKRHAPDAGASVACKAARGADDDNKCPICLESMDSNSTVFLACGHGFHAQCAVKHLQKVNRKCPVCRHVDDDGDLDYDGIEASEDVVAVRLEKLRRTTLEAMLMDYNVDKKTVIESSDEELIEMLVEQLHYETDDEH